MCLMRKSFHAAQPSWNLGIVQELFYVATIAIKSIGTQIREPIDPGLAARLDWVLEYGAKAGTMDEARISRRYILIWVT